MNCLWRIIFTAVKHACLDTSPVYYVLHENYFELESDRKIFRDGSYSCPLAYLPHKDLASINFWTLSRPNSARGLRISKSSF